jgi:hypothetical protein
MISVARLAGQTFGGMFSALTLGLVASNPNAACLTLAAGTAYLAAAISASRLRA